MMRIKRGLAGLLLAGMLGATAVATAAPERSADGVWEEVAVSSIATRGETYIRPAHFRTYALNDRVVASMLARAPAADAGGPGLELSLPMPHGKFERFAVHEISVMAPELAARYPEIRTYAGVGIDDPTAWVRLDRTPAGFHAMARGASGTMYIDPYQYEKGQAVGNNYISYHKHELTSSGDRAFKCDIHDSHTGEAPKASSVPARMATGSELRTYRLAVATTGEYAQFHGGTVQSAQAAIVTAINRVSGLYETELAIRLVLIPNNDDVIFLNSGSDPYTNNNGFAMLGQNQSELDSTIGAANYDIGHVFSTGGGGVAGLGVVCRNFNKGRGVTGLNNPIGDPFYVDFVAHEMGHQFGANHTFNGTASACASPNRNGSTAYEPGSGSTIMAYAGICGSHNIANASDDHFHTASFSEIGNYTMNSSGNACAAITATGNQAPLVSAGTPYLVPINTPLRLSGSANDPDGDPLVYRWEQFDLGPGGSPNSPSGNAPLFRSFSAVSAPTRYLPKLNDILGNTQSVGERLPTYGRSLRFRLTALDQRAGGGGVDFSLVSHTVTDEAGPFDITSQNTTTTWTPGLIETVTWDVANTDQDPINCSEVNVLFSADLGQTFPTILAGSTPNDGSQDIIVPDIQTSVGRIMVECVDNIFLDINNVNVTVLELPDPDFLVNIPDDVLQVCAPDDGDVAVDVLSVGGFTGSVSLSTSGTPAAVTSAFSANPVNAGNASTLTLGNIASATPGDYTVTVSGNGSTGTRNDTLTLSIGEGFADMATLLTPATGATSVELLPTLTWSPAAGATSYAVEIATDSGFGNIVYSATEASTSHVVTASLAFATDYFWRVSAVNFCGDSFSASSTFRTQSAPVISCAFPGAAIPDNASPIESSLTVTDMGSVVDLDVFVDVTHGASGHLVFSLRNESTGTVVPLMDQPSDLFFPGGCPTADVQNTFDDEAEFPAEDFCNATPPGVGPRSQPDAPLSNYDGESINGEWTLIASDATSGTAGTLNGWCVEVVFDDAAPVDTDGDGVADSADNCTLIVNPDQRDTNGDGYGNLCDADLNNDLVVNAVDLGLFRLAFFSSDGDADFNGDGVVNVVDLGILRQLFFAPPGPSGVAP